MCKAALYSKEFTSILWQLKITEEQEYVVLICIENENNRTVKPVPTLCASPSSGAILSSLGETPRFPSRELYILKTVSKIFIKKNIYF